MRFLEGPLSVMRLINLYTEPPITIASIKIPSIAIVVFVYLSLLSTLIPCVYGCFLNVNNFLSLLPSILVISTVFSLTMSYTFCLSIRRFIIESVEQWESYVQQSKHIFFKNLWFIVAVWYLKRPLKSCLVCGGPVVRRSLQGAFPSLYNCRIYLYNLQIRLFV